MSRDKPIDPKTLRVFGSLKDAVRVDGEFFTPLSAAEQNAWDGNTEPGSSHDEKETDAPNVSEQANDPTP